MLSLKNWMDFSAVISRLTSYFMLKLNECNDGLSPLLLQKDKPVYIFVNNRHKTSHPKHLWFSLETEYIAANLLLLKIQFLSLLTKKLK